VQVLLHDDVTPASEIRILVADDRGARGRDAGRILGAVDETQQVALVEVLEPMHFVDDSGMARKPVGHQPGEFEADVETTCPQVKQQVSRGRDGAVLGADHFCERVQTDRRRIIEEPTPQSRPDPHNAAEARIRPPETDRPREAGHVGKQIANTVFCPRVHRRDQEYRYGGWWRQHILRRRRHTFA
jgi:hypothetical protein